MERVILVKRVTATLLGLIFLVGVKGTNVSTNAADSTTDIFALEKNTLLQRIAHEKTRIAYEFSPSSNNFLPLVDSVSSFIIRQQVTNEKRNSYLNRLLVFLQHINRSYSESYFKSGLYSTVLSYYPILIEWDMNQVLAQNLERFFTFSIKAIRLIPNDTIAATYVSNYTSAYPDEIFRYTEEFDDRSFALKTLEQAVKLAPESAKRYYATDNAVYDLLSQSNQPEVLTSFEIYEQLGIKSRAYLLIDKIARHEMSLSHADSLCANRENLFHYLVRLSMRDKANINHSMFRYLDYYSVDLMRKVGDEPSTPLTVVHAFEGYTSDEMFLLLCYGHKDQVFTIFNQLLLVTNEKSAGVPVSNELVSSLNREKLKSLVIYCEDNRILETLLRLVDDETKEYLIGLTAEIKKEDIAPPLQPFASNTVFATSRKPMDRSSVITTETKPATKQSAGVNTVPDASADKQVIISGVKKEATSATTVVVNKTEITQPTTYPLTEPLLLEPVEPVKITLDERAKTLVAFKKNILHSIQDIPSFIETDYAETLLCYAAEKEPDELLKKVDQFKNKRFSKTVLEQCAKNAPVSLKRYLYNNMQPANYILQHSTDPVVKKIFELNEQIGYRSKPLLLLDDMISGKMKAAEAIETSKEPEKLYAAMVGIISRPQYVARYSIDHEMRDYCLRFIREINDKIAAGNAQPFTSVEPLTSQSLYFLMLYGRDEVFSSTFSGLFKRFIQRLPHNNGNAFFQSVNFSQFRNFLSLCSNFGTLQELLITFPKDSRQQLLVNYISGLENEKDNLSSIVLIAEAVSNLHEPELLMLLQSHIRKEYERVTIAKDQFGISIYGVLSSMISGNAVAEVAWYKKVARQFSISPVASLSYQMLSGTNETCIQQMYFYNDDDGRTSFINFLNTYRNHSSWSIEEKKSYVRVYSKTGAPIEIFANRPEHEETGITDIQAFFAEKQLSPSVVIHRGHSFYTESTLQKVPSTARLIFVGSCGGFYKISTALENAPEAHVISTKQIGTKTVNDALLFAINENIRSGKDIVWNEFWDKMSDKFSNNAYFSDYVPPNKNLESIFFRAYYKTLGV